MTTPGPRTCAAAGCSEQATAFFDRHGERNVFGLCAAHSERFPGDLIELRGDHMVESGEQEYILRFREE
jgi:hypothetical protein